MSLRAARRPEGRILLTARWLVGHAQGRHRLYENGEIVFEDGEVVFTGHGFPGEVARRIDYGNALIGPGFVDCDALSDLDTTILAYDNQPAWKKGRVWPRSYLEAGPYEMYSREELAFQKKHAFATLIRNGITTALPIASLFYRAWGETPEEFQDAAEAAAGLGLRAYLGPAYRTGNQLVEADGRITTHYDEPRGLAELDAAIEFCERNEGAAGGLIRTMLAPDRIETSTAELLRRTAAAGRALKVPVRLHCCQSKIEYDLVLAQHGMSPPEWLQSLGFLDQRSLLPHGTYVSGSRHVERPGRDLEIIRDAGATIVHCPLVSGRHGNAIDHFGRYREMGLKLAMGTDTSPPDMIMNLQVGMILARTMAGSVHAARSEDYYDVATLGGAEALGRPDLGRLQPGARADITVFDLDRPHLGQVIDPIQTMLLAGHGRDFATVIIDGRFVMEERVIPGVDEAADKLRAQKQFEGVMARYPQRTHGHPAASEIFSSSYVIERAGGAT
ncbi:cytosine/adenosine deaminase-related metal-dependent hydrolase [Bosea sp. BE125]|uniref:amidohydrolase family protein n=1 Tax=Bosea sp. BE125 TaxID=2817909 RepID=UPI00285902DD|nr:amidohydrolase family protein [Bosea sp. BE125]MDR6873969.1 cytosine/adenosine deaminase-related metal-dependent hydrolase [Bosea sp. BE125]